MTGCSLRRRFDHVTIGSQGNDAVEDTESQEP